MEQFARFWKAWLATLGPVIAAITAAVTDDQITQSEVVMIVGAFVGVLFVLFGPRNKERHEIIPRRNSFE